jgi:putative transposase
LKEVNSQSLQAILENLDVAYNKFFKKWWWFPNFKKKWGNQSAKIPQHFKIEWNRIYIPKMKLWLKFVKHREIEWKVKSLTISQDTDLKYYVSILVEREMIEDKKTNKEVGIDLWLKDLAITSDWNKYKTKKQNTKEIERLQMRQSKKQKWSRRYKQLKTKIARLHKANANKRNDYLHKISRSIVKEYDLIGLENLNVKWMMWNHKLAKAIWNQWWSDLVNKLTYKSDWYWKQVHQISRRYPTSKQCSKCWNVKKVLKLSEREYQCEVCWYIEDRDINASKNILQYTKVELKF